LSWRVKPDREKLTERGAARDLPFGRKPEHRWWHAVCLSEHPGSDRLYIPAASAASSLVIPCAIPNQNRWSSDRSDPLTATAPIRQSLDLRDQKLPETTAWALRTRNCVRTAINRRGLLLAALTAGAAVYVAAVSAAS
jgi:hypothetical protein